MESLQFMELEIKPQILKAIAHMGFEEMTPIQARAIPVELSGLCHPDSGEAQSEEEEAAGHGHLSDQRAGHSGG